MSEQVDEDVDEFRARARAWIRENLDPRGTRNQSWIDVDVERALQARMFDAGFAGFAFPSEYGGAGMTIEHQKAFFEEAAEFVTPTYFGVSIGMLGATILDLETHLHSATGQLSGHLLPQTRLQEPVLLR